MATTTVQPLPYPLPGDPADGPAQIKALAEAVEGRVVMRFASLAARDAALPSGTLVNGMVCHIAADNGVYVRAGGQWRLLWIDSGWINVALNSGFTFNMQPQVRRIGQVVYWRGDVQGPFTPSPTNVAAPAAIPSWAIPGRSYRDSTSPLAGNTPTFAAQGVLDGTNGLRIATSTTATNAVNLAGLSGYTVD